MRLMKILAPVALGASTLAAGAAFNAATAVGPASTINFDVLPAGTQVTTVSNGSGIVGAAFGAVGVTGQAKGAAINTAQVFDAECGGNAATCTGGDKDQFHPGQGKILIIGENTVDTSPANGLVDNPDDNDGGGTVTLSFTSGVDLEKLTVLDIDDDEKGGTITGYRGATQVAKKKVPITGNGLKKTVNVGFTNIDKLVIVFKSSGGVDDIRFSPSCVDGTPNPQSASSTGSAQALYVDADILGAALDPVTQPIIGGVNQIIANLPLNLNPIQDVLVVDSPGVMSAQAGPGSDMDASAPTLPVNPLLSLDLLPESSSAVNDATTATGMGSSGVLDLNLFGIPGLAIEADVVQTKVTATAHGTGGEVSFDGTTVAKLTINGTTYLDVEPNTYIPINIPGLGLIEVYVNEQQSSTSLIGGKWTATGMANAVRIVVPVIDGLLPTGALIIVGHSDASAAFGQVSKCVPAPTYEVYGDAKVLKTPGGLLGGLLDPIVVHAGPLPAGGGADSAAAVGAFLDPLLLDTTARAATAGGYYPGVGPAAASVAEVENLKLLIPGGPLLEVSAVRARSEVNPAGAVPEVEILGLSIGGQDICTALGLDDPLCKPLPGTVYEIPGLIKITFNVQDDGAGGTCGAGDKECKVEAMVIDTPIGQIKISCVLSKAKTPGSATAGAVPPVLPTFS